METVFAILEWLLLSPQNTSSKKGKPEAGKRTFLPGLRKEMWPSEGGRYLAEILEGTEPDFQL